MYLKSIHSIRLPKCTLHVWRSRTPIHVDSERVDTFATSIPRITLLTPCIQLYNAWRLELFTTRLGFSTWCRWIMNLLISFVQSMASQSFSVVWRIEKVYKWYIPFLFGPQHIDCAQFLIIKDSWYPYLKIYPLLLWVSWYASNVSRMHIKGAIAVSMRHNC